MLNSGSPERGARSPERPSLVAESRTRGQGAEVERRFHTPRRSYPAAGERVWCVILGALPFVAGVLAFEYLFGVGPRVIVSTVLIVGAVVLLLVAAILLYSEYCVGPGHSILLGYLLRHIDV